MANVYFTDEFKVCSIGKDPAYLYIDSVEDFFHDCGDDYVVGNVEQTGVYQWDDYNCLWELADSKIDKIIKALVIEEINSLYKETSHQNNDKSIGWNILVALNTGDVIQTNSVPLSIKEIPEVIDILLRPSFFGKTIKEFKIVAV